MHVAAAGHDLIACGWELHGMVDAHLGLPLKHVIGLHELPEVLYLDTLVWILLLCWVAGC